MDSLHIREVELTRPLNFQSYVYEHIVDCLPGYCKLLMLRGNNKVGIDCQLIIDNKYDTSIAVDIEITSEACVTIVTRGGSHGSHTVADMDVEDIMPYLSSVYSCK